MLRKVSRFSDTPAALSASADHSGRAAVTALAEPPEVAVVQVVAKSVDESRQIVADDLADELPGFEIGELQPTGAPNDAAAGIHRRSGLLLFPTSADA